MVNIQDKLNDFSTRLNTLESASTERISNLKNLLNSLQTDASQISISHSGDEGKITTLENEVKLQEGNIAAERSSINELQTTLDQLNPDHEAKKTTLSELETSMTTLQSRKSELVTELGDRMTKKDSLQNEEKEKSQALNDLESSIEGDLVKINESLELAKKGYNDVLQSNAVWDYMFEILETPEIEIMAIIAANRGISLDDIKQKATSVSPVFVGRSISKLEADGKIVSSGDLWDISPSLLELIS
ncbi:MAG: hypothetical protein ACXAE3_11880 [Candidatus Kariarchaeaceae archaeon]|jgi:chromosome segregation ATPase